MIAITNPGTSGRFACLLDITREIALQFETARKFPQDTPEFVQTVELPSNGKVNMEAFLLLANALPPQQALCVTEEEPLAELIFRGEVIPLSCP